MTKFKKLLLVIRQLIRAPWLIEKIIEKDLYWEKYISNKFGNIITLPQVELSDICKNLNESVNHYSFLSGSSLVTDIILLKCLAKRFTNCRYFEIGTWRGESVTNVSEVATECYTLNPQKNDLIKMGEKEAYANLQGFYSKKHQNIIHIEANSIDYDFSTLGKKFDLNFIDGNHHYKYVKNDTINIFKHLIHDKSIIVWHDYGYNPEKVNPEVLSAILDSVPNELRKYIYHVANTMCAVFIREELKASELIYPKIPLKNYKISISIENIT